MSPQPPSSTLFPYTTLFRSGVQVETNQGYVDDLYALYRAAIPGLQLVKLGNRRSIESIEIRSEEHTSELQSQLDLVCRLLLEKKKKKNNTATLLTSHLILCT